MKTKTLITTALATLVALSLHFNARADITTSLSGYWKLNDGPGSSTATDSSGNANTGTLTGFANGTFVNMWTNGGPVNNTTLFFNQNGETANYITVANSSTINQGQVNREWTLSAWVKPSVAGGSQVANAGIVAKGKLNLEQYTLVFEWRKVPNQSAQ